VPRVNGFRFESLDGVRDFLSCGIESGHRVSAGGAVW
jgi:hypothetical protein